LRRSRGPTSTAGNNLFAFAVSYAGQGFSKGQNLITSWRIYERDVDVVLAEEFYANDQFANWALSQSKSFSLDDTKVVEVSVSLSDRDGESDLVVVFERINGGRIALLVEDKIDAQFQPDQLNRYRRRGDSGIAAGSWKEFEVVLFAPRSYIERHSIAQQFDFTLGI
jgi:hypothetical protein